jgi:hypothetical protein
MTKMIKTWQKIEIWVFFALIVLANTAFIQAVKMNLLSHRTLNLGRFVILAFVLLLVVYAFRGIPGVRKVFIPLSIWRISPWWYLLALLWAPSIAVIVLLAKGLAAGTGAAEVWATSEWISRPSVIRTVVIGSLVGEIVWVGYAIRSLSTRFTILIASLIVGFFWWMWWTPLVFMEAGISIIPGLPPFALLVNVLGAAAMCGFIYAHTNSGIAVFVLQLVLNSSVLIFPVSPAEGGAATYWAFVTVYLIAGVGMHILFGPRPLIRQYERQASLLSD